MDLGLCDKITLFMNCCSLYDKDRSYLYIREGSIERNIAFVKCCGAIPQIWDVQDHVYVEYFDRPPYQPVCCFDPYHGTPAEGVLCILGPTEPKLEVVKLGCMCLCQYMDPCMCGSKVVLMPFEKWCLCCSNRVGCCDNNCGLCGPPTGNPKVYSPFAPQPKNPEEFVSVAKEVMFGAGGSPEVIVRE